jgi:hypothetical protein
MRRVLFVIAALGVACHDWSNAIAACVDAGVCVVGNGSGGGTGGVGGGTASSGGGTGAVGGGVGNTGGGTSNTGGGAGATGGGGSFGPWALQAMPAAVAVGNGGTATTEILITRPAQNVATPVLLRLGADSTDAGIAAYFFENNVPAAIPFPMYLRAPFDFPAGTYPITVNASYDGGFLASTTVSLTVRSRATTLLVDGDRSLNNQGAGPFLSQDDAFFIGLLDRSAIPYDTFVNPSSNDGGITAQQINNYNAVVWSTGWSSGTIGPDSQNEHVLQQWLDQGGKKLILVSQYYTYDVSDTDGWATPLSNFAVDYLGLAGGVYTQGSFPFTVTGVANTALQGLSLDTVGPASGIPDDADLGLINLDGGSPLLTVPYDPDSTGTRPIACASIKTGVGALHTSTFEYVGVPLPNAADPDAGFFIWEALRTAASWP